ncbi:MAG: xylulokinase [Terrimesophilobacter sp.]
MPLVAGVDSSTQSCKVIIRELDSGAVVRTGRARHPGGTEVDPEAWWTALLAAAADAGGFDDVSAISIAGQQHGMVALDAACEVIRPALLWNDTRSAQAAVDLVNEVGAESFALRTGTVPVASFTITKLRWLRDHEPDNAARVAAVALPHDWLTWRLRGFGPSNPQLEQLVTDRSDASGTSYFDPATNSYDLDLLSTALGRDPRNPGVVLPRILRPAEFREVGAAAPGIRKGTVVGAGMGDNAGAALGLGAATGDVIVSLGTSGTVFAVTDRPVRDASGTVAGFADAAGGYLPLVATLNAARSLDVIAALLGADHAELGRLALTAQPGSDGIVLVPWFEGERTPNRPDATASLTGMTLASTTASNLARATIEGMLCGLADGLDAVRAQGITAERILLIGGAAQNSAVQAIAAQVFDVPVVVPELSEYVAFGAATQAAWALTGERPAWPVPMAATPPEDYRPVIREQYAAAASAPTNSSRSPSPASCEVGLREPSIGGG